MKRAGSSTVAAWAWAVAVAAAPSAEAPNEGLRLSQLGVADAYTLSWWGVPGRTYFVQHSADLVSGWHYLPVIERGEGGVLAVGLAVEGAQRFFLRLRHTDVPSADPYAEDFDGDGIPNGWEIERGLDPFDAADAGAAAGGGLTWLQVFLQAQAAAGEPAAANAVGLVVYSP